MIVNTTQRWQERRVRYRPAGEVIDTGRYGVEVLPTALARAFVERHHYSGSWCAERLSCGLYRTNGTSRTLCGVAVFAEPMQQRATLRHLGLSPRESVELSRLVLLHEEPTNAESFFVARAFRLVRQEKKVRGVLSYADPVARETHEGDIVKLGHVGVVYQALNGRYVGRSSRRVLILDKAGRAVNGRTLSKVRLGERGRVAALRLLADLGAPARQPFEDGADYVKRALREGPFRRLPHPGNLAYAWAFDDDAKAGLPEALPYVRLETP